MNDTNSEHLDITSGGESSSSCGNHSGDEYQQSCGYKPNPESSGWIEVLDILLAASSEFLLLLLENLTESSDFVSLVLIMYCSYFDSMKKEIWIVYLPL
ncbi:hypothetical protein Tco_0459304 [Tanacetum coccineum]